MGLAPELGQSESKQRSVVISDPLGVVSTTQGGSSVTDRTTLHGWPLQYAVSPGRHVRTLMWRTYCRLHGDCTSRLACVVKLVTLGMARA